MKSFNSVIFIDSDNMSERRRSSLASKPHDDGILRANDDVIRRLSQAHDSIGKETADARNATEAEKSLSVRQAVRLYKRAICFSLVMSLAVVMEGYVDSTFLT